MPFDPTLGYVPSGQGYAPLQAYNQNFDPESGQQAPTGGVGANPYPYFRYAYQGPQFQGYGGPQNNLYMGYEPYYGTAIDRMAANNRSLALTGGMQLQQDLANYANYNYGQAGNYTDMLNSAYGNIAQGGGGYTDAQKEAILNNQALQGLRMTPEQQASNYLSDEESAGVRGNPYAAFDYADQAGQNISGLYSNFAGQIGDALGSQEGSINNVLGASGNAMRGQVSDWGGRSDQSLSDIAALTRGAVGATSGNVNNALGQAGGNVRSYIDPNYLTVSPEYMTNYQVRPEDMQGIMNQAGRTVGAQAAMDEENLQAAANAAGNVNPMALAAARNRIRVTGAINSANAMSDAAIKAKQLQLGTSQNRENTRLGAEQTYAGLGTSNEQQLGTQNVNAQFGLGQQALNNEQYMGSNTLNQKNQLGQAGLSAEQYLAGQNLAGQQYLGNSRLANTQALLGTGMQQAQYNAGLGTGALQGAEAAASNRAGTLANARLAGNQYNQGQDFTRGQYIYGAGSQANLGFANNQQQQEKEYRDYLAAAQNQANQNATVGNQQRTGAYSATNQGVQGATTGAIQNYAVPGLGEKIAKLFARGGVERGPQTALVGEAGPELVIDLPSYGGGGEIDSGSGESDDPEGSGWIHGEQVKRGQDLGRNPIYDKIVRGAQMGGMTQGNTAQTGEDPTPGKGKGLIGNALGIAGLFFAKGGIVPPQSGHHPYGKRGKPKAELVTGPQVRTLGAKVPQAVVPLTRRKGNKLNVEDIPNLMAGRR